MGKIEVITALPGLRFLDPRVHNLAEPKDYTEWDLTAIENCDFVLGYMEQSNPGGYSLALEVGYAAALGKKVILVLEPSPEGGRDYYFEMVRQVSDQCFDTLTLGIEGLKRAVEDASRTM